MRSILLLCVLAALGACDGSDEPASRTEPSEAPQVADERSDPDAGSLRDKVEASASRTGYAGALTLASDDSMRLSRQEFIDPARNGMVSHTALVPAGWRATGGAFYPPSAYFSAFPSQRIEIASADGLLVAIEPMFSGIDREMPGMPSTAIGTPIDGLPAMPYPTDLAGWRRWIQSDLINESFPEAERVRVEDADEVRRLTRALKRAFAPTKSLLESGNDMAAAMGMRTKADCSVLAFASRYEIGGEAFEELRLIGVTSAVMETTMAGRLTTWSTERTIVLRAPEGTLEEHAPLLESIAASVRPTESWTAAWVRDRAAMLGVPFAEVMGLASAVEVRARVLTEADPGRAGARESRLRQLFESLAKTATFPVPDAGARVDLPTTYRSVFASGAGEYLLTNDESLEGVDDLELGDTSWTKLRSL